MKSRFDIVSERTGRVILSSLFDAPPDGVKGGQIRSLVAALSRAKKDLEKIFGEGQVRVSLDSFEGSVFWYLILFRPFYFSSDHPLFGDKKYSVYDMIKKGGAAELQKTDLGLVYDKENNWLIFLWDEAEELLDSIKICPSWERILKDYKKRVGTEAEMDWWRQCAESLAWVLPHWSLHKMRYLRSKLWFRPESSYKNVSVLNLEGIELLRMEGEGKGLPNEAELQVARRVKYAHHYTTSDKREFRSVRKLERKLKEDEEKSGAEKAQKATEQKLRRKGLDKSREFRGWFLASRLVQQLPKHLGRSIPGKYKKHLSGRESLQRFEIVLNAYMNGEIELGNVGWTRVHTILSELQTLLNDKDVPTEFGEWLVWRDRGIHVDAYIERRQR